MQKFCLLFRPLFGKRPRLRVIEFVLNAETTVLHKRYSRVLWVIIPNFLLYLHTFTWIKWFIWSCLRKWTQNLFTELVKDWVVSKIWLVHCFSFPLFLFHQVKLAWAEAITLWNIKVSRKVLALMAGFLLFKSVLSPFPWFPHISAYWPVLSDV